MASPRLAGSPAAKRSPEVGQHQQVAEMHQKAGVIKPRLHGAVLQPDLTSDVFCLTATGLEHALRCEFHRSGFDLDQQRVPGQVNDDDVDLAMCCSCAQLPRDQSTL